MKNVNPELKVDYKIRSDKGPSTFQARQETPLVPLSRAHTEA